MNRDHVIGCAELRVKGAVCTCLSLRIGRYEPIGHPDTWKLGGFTLGELTRLRTVMDTRAWTFEDLLAALEMRQGQPGG